MKFLSLTLFLLMTNAPIVPAQNSSRGEFYSFRLKPHDDLKQGIITFAKQNKIKAGAIVSCVGSLEQCAIRFANQEEIAKEKGHFEIVSLVGTFSDDGSHIHISVSDSLGKTIGGHLADGNRIYTTAEIVIVDLKDLEFAREADTTYGYQELVIRKKKQK